MAIETFYCAKTDIGLKRHRNEDCFCADYDLGLYVVCDGMGGENAGEVASTLAVNSIQTYMAAQPVTLICRSSVRTTPPLRLTGWFAPKDAARIVRRGSQYSISPTQRMKKVLVNGAAVITQQELKNCDQIEVAGVTLSFFLTPSSKTLPR